ncbi:MAG: hypothetical protein GX594_00765, partial [Pirellulaceae bacterium]|nr:hypothetical protein [Pirellulaceae bacterium]
MSARDREQADLRSSIVQWCERRLPEKDSHRLMRTLKSDADARRLFAEYNALVALLELEIPTLLREQELPDAAPATRALGAELEDSEACGRWS